MIVNDYLFLPRPKQLEHQSTIDSDSSDSEYSSTELETRSCMRSVLERTDRVRKMEERSSRRKLGFGDLCRYFQRSMTQDTEDETAKNVS